MYARRVQNLIEGQDFFLKCKVACVKTIRCTYISPHDSEAMPFARGFGGMLRVAPPRKFEKK